MLEISPSKASKGFNEMGIIPRAISPQPTGRLIWYLPGGMIWWATAQVPAVPVVLPGGMIWWATSKVPAVAVVSVVPAVTAPSFGYQISATATTVSGAIYAAVTTAAKAASMVLSVAASFGASMVKSIVEI